MPVVDAYASLESGEQSVRDYFNYAKSVHVLRMVAVLRSGELPRLSRDLTELQSQSTTPGLGGFPNAVVCPCNIDDAAAISTLISSDAAQLLSGVCHEMIDVDDVPVSTLDSLDLLSRHGLSLDVGAKRDQYFIVKKWADAQPKLAIILNIHLGCFVDTKKHGEAMRESLAFLASSDNIHLKLFGAGLPPTNLEEALGSSLNYLLTLFGDQRIMFGTGCFSRSRSVSPSMQSAEKIELADNQNEDAASFDQLWTIYMEKSSAISARARDNIFRNTAMRIYLK